MFPFIYKHPIVLTLLAHSSLSEFVPMLAHREGAGEHITQGPGLRGAPHCYKKLVTITTTVIIKVLMMSSPSFFLPQAPKNLSASLF